ncbi:MAG TPA: YegS/Rv2252/BmrU family lipid kinase [Vicinamibacterales bacterium]|nr:YegS/Rv2252/BmrU family lipid kinase [Vicinamibacterales bacterium]
MSVAIIINPISGGARPNAAQRRARAAIDAVERHGDRPEVFVTERPGHARELARAALARGVRLVIAWGGDGTINEVASALVFGEIPLGIVPAGSGNGLARELGVQTRPERAIASALAAAPRPIDVGEVSGRFFVNIAGVGFDAEVAARFNHPGNTTRGLRGYAALTARSFFTYRAREYTLGADEQRLRTRALMIVIANGTEFGNRILIARGARVDDGVLDLVVVEERSLAGTIGRVPWLVARQIHRVPQWSSRPARRVTIDCSEPMTFHVDGEPVQGGTRLEARIHPGALGVCV